MEDFHDLKEKVMELAKRRGFLWPSYEIYGGVAGMWDYGPLGGSLKRRVETIWRDMFVISEGFYEIETPTIGIEDVFIASGHVSSFVDLIVECIQCHTLYRADHLVTEYLSKMGVAADLCESDIQGACVPSRAKVQEQLDKYRIPCPDCGGALGDVHDFNLMFKTQIGPGTLRKGYLRPETAQGIFIAFPRLVRFARDKLPFGVVQIGKSYRNEISPRQGVIRLREFTHAEAEVFVNPQDKERHPRFREIAQIEINILSADFAGTRTIGEACKEGIIAHEYLGYHIGKAHQFFVRVGIIPEKLRFRQHLPDEMAHYANDCWDAEALTYYGWIELAGIADRTDYDLTQHADQSGTEMKVFLPFDRPQKVERRIVKPNMGYLGPTYKGDAKRIAEALTSMDDPVEPLVVCDETINPAAYTIEVISEEATGDFITPHIIEPSYGIDRTIYTVLEHAYDEDIIEGEKRVILRLPPNVAPIQAGVFPLVKVLRTKAIAVAQLLKIAGYQTEYDDSGTIGRRYRRHDEIGTPFCVTIDHQTLEDETVTIRERDTTRQQRTHIASLAETLREMLSAEKTAAQQAQRDSVSIS